MVAELASKIDTNTEATKYEIPKMRSIGKVLDSTASTSKIQNQQMMTVPNAMQSFATTMKTAPIVLTNENLAACLRTRMKAFREDEQKFSLEIAR